MKRSSGILMPVSSLPSKYGIGTLGKEAYNFIDFLVRADQSYWQVLPIGPTSYGDSPYQSFSSFAGDPYYIDLDLLVKDGLLKRSDLKGLEPFSENYVDYNEIYSSRFEILAKAYRNMDQAMLKEFRLFVRENRWLDNYALFMAIKKHFGMKCWIEWPDRKARMRDSEALRKYRTELNDDFELYSFIQFLFYRQFAAVKAYAHEKGIKIIGDMPIYVPLDSSDVWADPECFQLDSENIPTAVAGVPPDYFSPDGQLWGNPLYDWDHMKKDGYKWWIERVDAISKCFDVVRIDHFRGFDSYWSVPYGEKTAKRGKWIDGPGIAFVSMLTSWFNDVEFIAEDLGLHTPGVQKLLDDSKLPGMKVLQFAFSAQGASDHAPHDHRRNTICYVGTHDNSTALGWKKLLKPEDLQFVYDYLNIHEEDDFAYEMIKAGMRSVSDLFIGCMWDYLRLDDSARMNTPGTVGNNWKWRMSPGAADRKLAEKIAAMTRMYRRGRPVVKKTKAVSKNKKN